MSQSEAWRTALFLQGANLMDNRVVVTGMGIVSPAGNTLEAAWGSWSKGASNTCKLPGYDFAGAPAAAPLLDYSQLLTDKRPLSRPAAFALSALTEALSQAKLLASSIDPFTSGVIVGSGLSMSNDAVMHELLIKSSPEDINLSEFEFFSCGYHPAACISSALGIRKLCKSVSNACASGAYSVCLGYELVKNGDLSLAITGGADSVLNANGLSLFSVLEVMSKETDYVKASKPFDKNRSGFVVGEGAGILILEPLSRAQKRNAPIFAEILGYSTLTDTYHMTTPDPTGETVENLIVKAVSNSGLPLSSIEYINANGTSTYCSDLAETCGIKRAFGKQAYDIPISSLKSMIGHLISAAGAVELIATILSLNNSAILPTINYEHADPDCDLDYVPNIIRKRNINHAISNSFGFGGQNVCVVLGGANKTHV